MTICVEFLPCIENGSICRRCQRCRALIFSMLAPRPWLCILFDRGTANSADDDAKNDGSLSQVFAPPSLTISDNETGKHYASPSSPYSGVIRSEFLLTWIGCAVGSRLFQRRFASGYIIKIRLLRLVFLLNFQSPVKPRGRIPPAFSIPNISSDLARSSQFRNLML